MPIVTAQPSFTGGELSPDAYGRVDYDRYDISLKKMRNFLAHVYGGASNRPGTYFAGEVDDSTVKHRLIPFVFSTSQQYILVFGDQTLEFVTAGGFIELTGVRVKLTTVFTAAELSEINYTQSADIMYLFHPNHYPQKLERHSHTSWTIGDAPFSDGPYRKHETSDEDIRLTLGGRTGSSVTLTASSALFSSDDVGIPFRFGFANPDDPNDIQWGWGNIASVTDSQNATIDLDDFAGYEWLANANFKAGLAGWYLGDKGTITFNDATQNVTIKGDGTDKAQIGQKFQCQQYANGSIQVKISAITNTTTIKIGPSWNDGTLLSQTVTTAGTYTYTFQTQGNSSLYVTIETDTSATNSSTIDYISAMVDQFTTTQWRQGAWSDARGYPSVGLIHQQRLFCAATDTYPDTYWASKIGDYEDFGFSSPYEADDSFSNNLPTGKVDRIRWLTILGDMIVGTEGAEWKISASSGNALTPTTAGSKLQSHYGSANLFPIVIGNSILFVQVGGKVVDELTYSLEQDGYVASDISLLSNHFFEKYSVVEWTFARLPYSIIWAIREDGSLCGLSYMKEQKVEGWHLHTTDGYFESVASIQDSSGVDVPYFEVKRTINSVTKRYIEFMMPRIDSSDLENCFFVDCGLSYDGAATTTLSGLSHLEGKVVWVFADGAKMPPVTVSGGSITLDRAVSKAHVGLGYTSYIETLPVELQLQNSGSTQGAIKAIPQVAIVFKDSLEAKVGPPSQLDPVSFRTPGLGEGPVPLTSESVLKAITTTFSRETSLRIEAIGPQPVTVLSIVPRTDIADL